LRSRLASLLASALTRAFATAFAVQALAAQTALTVPDGLPAWAFNIPDAVHRIGFPTNIRPRRGPSKATPELTSLAARAI
jgi:hypothetical protein